MVAFTPSTKDERAQETVQMTSMEQVPDGVALTSSEAAALLDVHTSTVKRWCNDGELESELTPGGHRRISIHAATTFARDRGIGTILVPFHPYEPQVWTVLRAITEDGSFKELTTLQKWIAELPAATSAHLCIGAARKAGSYLLSPQTDEERALVSYLTIREELPFGYSVFDGGSVWAYIMPFSSLHASPPSLDRKVVALAASRCDRA